MVRERMYVLILNLFETGNRLAKDLYCEKIVDGYTDLRLKISIT